VAPDGSGAPARGAGEVGETARQMDPYDELPDAVLVAGPDGRVTGVNAAARRLLGAGAGAAIGRDYREVLPLADPAGGDWWRRASPYRGLATRTGHPERLLELRGHQLLVASRYVRERPGGPVVRLVVSLRDARARQRAERDRADLVSTVAHEIRSPLTTVKGFTATLLSRWDRLADPQKRDMLAAVEADADRVTRLLSDLLDVSRIDAGRLRLRPQVVDLAEVARRVVAGRVAAGDPPDRFLLLVAPAVPETWLDPDRVAQVVANLVDNAVRHGAGTVTLRLCPAGGGVELTVTDEGPGVDPAVRARVFSRFWRSGRGGGTGLGLYVVKGIAEAHGGRVEVADGPGGGARFRVWLPAGAAPYEQ
jgi:signal transduction histidine kinase